MTAGKGSAEPPRVDHIYAETDTLAGYSSQFREETPWSATWPHAPAA